MNFIHKPLMSGIAICLTFFAYSCATPEKTENKTDFTAYVDPYIGSGEHGHVFVGANVPFGAVQVGPQNIFKGWDWCSGYHYSDSIIIGFSHTHLSGTGCSDLGDILLMPYTGEVRTARGEQDNIEGAASSYYKHANEAVAPGYYSLLMDNGVKAELTATERVALHRYTYPSGSEHRLLINLKEGIGDKAYDTYLKKIDEYTIEGYRFSKAMRSPAFIGVEDIKETYLPMGFSNFKLEGRGLGSALVLEFLLYYLTRPEYQIHVREAIYLDNMLDLF